jgi:hypothetical protein
MRDSFVRLTTRAAAATVMTTAVRRKAFFAATDLNNMQRSFDNLRDDSFLTIFHNADLLLLMIEKTASSYNTLLVTGCAK